jgi:hypothetical protein
MDEEPAPPPGYEDWKPQRARGGMIRWTPPPRSNRSPFVQFPHKRRIQWLMVCWLAFVLFCFAMAYLTRNN